MSIEMFRLHMVNMPLVRPFRTSFGTDTVREVLIVEAVSADGFSGWAECAASSWPGYSSEYTAAAIAVMTDHLIPALRETRWMVTLKKCERHLMSCADIQWLRRQ